MVAYELELVDDIDPQSYSRNSIYDYIMVSEIPNFKNYRWRNMAIKGENGDSEFREFPQCARYSTVWKMKKLPSPKKNFVKTTI